MPLSTDVKLPKSKPAAFPNRCVACSREAPDGSVTLWTLSVGWWVVLTAFAFLFSKATKARVPACRGCAWRMRLRRLATVTVSIALIVAGFAVVNHFWPRPQGLPRILHRLALCGAGIGVFLPFGIWLILHPPAIDLTLEGDQLRYEFRDPDYADEFAELNRAAVEP